MLPNNVSKKEIIMAFFDIMGSSQRIASGQLEAVYNFYDYMAKLCAKEDVPLATRAILPEEKGTEIVCLYPMKHAFFSDTFILWVEDDSFFEPRFGGFYEWCIRIFIEATKRGIPLRGAISRGQAIMDDENKIYLGEPLVEAAKLESMQSWLGITLGLSCRMVQPSEVFCLLPYHKHLKQEVSGIPKEN